MDKSQTDYQEYLDELRKYFESVTSNKTQTKKKKGQSKVHFERLKDGSYVRKSDDGFNDITIKPPTYLNYQKKIEKLQTEKKKILYKIIILKENISKNYEDANDREEYDKKRSELSDINNNISSLQEKYEKQTNTEDKKKQLNNLYDEKDVLEQEMREIYYKIKKYPVDSSEWKELSEQYLSTKDDTSLRKRFNNVVEKIINIECDLKGKYIGDASRIINKYEDKFYLRKYSKNRGFLIESEPKIKSKTKKIRKGRRKMDTIKGDDKGDVVIKKKTRKKTQAGGDVLEENTALVSILKHKGSKKNRRNISWEKMDKGGNLLNDRSGNDLESIEGIENINLDNLEEINLDEIGGEEDLGEEANEEDLEDNNDKNDENEESFLDSINIETTNNERMDGSEHTFIENNIMKGSEINDDKKEEDINKLKEVSEEVGEEGGVNTEIDESENKEIKIGGNLKKNSDINLIEQLNKKNEEKEKNEKKELEGDSENIKTITIKM